MQFEGIRPSTPVELGDGETTLSLLRALNSTVGKKFVMAITGLLLCGFLVFHLAGNVLMYVGPEMYNAYAHGLHSTEPLLYVAETGLAVLFFVHLYLAISTTLENTRARRRTYAEKESKVPRSGVRSDTWMFWSGVVVLGFLVLHITDFTVEGRESLPDPLHVPDAYHTLDGEEREPFDKAITLLANPITAGVYVIGCIFLIFHLLHGFRSAFQSLGLNNKAWDACLRYLSVIFALAIGFGFASFPILVYLKQLQ